MMITCYQLLKKSSRFLIGLKFSITDMVFKFVLRSALGGIVALVNAALYTNISMIDIEYEGVIASNRV